MELNSLTTFVFSFALVASVLAYGLWKLPRWMWYFGWVMFYLFAVYFGGNFSIMLIHSYDAPGFAYALCWLVGGLLIWMTGIVWWARNGHRFGAGGARDKGARPGAP